MGGADFDGDHIIICYDERVIEACRKSGYSDKGDIPFVQIPALAGGNGGRALGAYVSPQVVYNTFSSRIGRISNAAMKIAAVEYDSTLPVCEGIPSAAFCTILTGTEIDAAKKGLRPDIHNVIGYNGAEHETHKAVVNEVRKFIESKEILKTFSGNAPRLTVDKSGSIIWNKMKLYPNRQHNPVTQLLYRWGDAFIHFHESKEAQLPDGLPPLTSIFPDQNPSPRETGEILRAYRQVIAEYRQKQKKRDESLTLRAENRKKILTRFKGQYDDLDREDGISVRQRMERLQDALLELAQQYTPEEISALRDRLYSAGDAPFDATVFWPYGSAPSDNALLSDILTLPDADLLTQFRFEGYRLLYYFLDNIALTLTAQSIRPEAEEKDESYRARYLRIAAEYFVKSTSLAAFKKDLREAARNDLRAILACEAQEDVIRMLYPPKTAEQKKAFWDIFTTGEVLHTLGGDNDAR